MQKFSRYSLQNSLVTRAEVACCRYRSLLVAKSVHCCCKFTRYSLLVAGIGCLPKITRHLKTTRKKYFNFKRVNFSKWNFYFLKNNLLSKTKKTESYTKSTYKGSFIDICKKLKILTPSTNIWFSLTPSLLVQCTHIIAPSSRPSENDISESIINEIIYLHDTFYIC